MDKDKIKKALSKIHDVFQIILVIIYVLGIILFNPVSLVISYVIHFDHGINWFVAIPHFIAEHDWQIAGVIFVVLLFTAIDNWW